MSRLLGRAPYASSMVAVVISVAASWIQEEQKTQKTESPLLLHLPHHHWHGGCPAATAPFPAPVGSIPVPSEFMFEQERGICISAFHDGFSYRSGK